jgi:hypothetical protein
LDKTMAQARRSDRHAGNLGDRMPAVFADALEIPSFEVRAVLATAQKKGRVLHLPVSFSDLSS